MGMQVGSEALRAGAAPQGAVREWRRRGDARSAAREVLWCGLGSLAGAAACVCLGGLVLFVL